VTKPLPGPKRPVLRYHGGKWKLAQWVISHFPEHRVYTETFGGGASVLMRKPRAYAEIYNELEPDVVNVFRVMRDEAMALRLKAALELTPFSRTEYEEAFYTTSTDPIERARCTILKSFAGFGSSAITAPNPAGMRTRASSWPVRDYRPGTGFRATSNRSGTTPAHDWRNYPEQIVEFIERLRGVVIENRPAIDVIRQHDRHDTLHYVDPPYVRSTRVGYRQDRGYRHEMTDEDHRALSDELRACVGMVVLSGYHSPLYDELYKGWYRVDRPHRADGAAPRTEVLWLNPAASRALEKDRAGSRTLFANEAML
jgi:DNA adenine methylase